MKQNIGHLLILMTFLVPTLKAQVFIATHYPLDYHGTLLASGERYSKFSSTAACKNIPLGSEILITEKTTGRSTVVTINDSFEESDVDFLLSEKVFKELGIEPQSNIRISYKYLNGSAAPLAFANEIISTELRPKGLEKKDELIDLDKKALGKYWLQLGSFRSESSYLEFSSKIQSELNRGIFLEKVQSQGSILYRALLVGFSDRAEAEAFSSKLEAQGIKCLLRLNKS